MICPGEVLTLDASQVFDAQYIWNTGASVPSIDVVMPGEYMVTVMTPCYTISNVANVIAAVDCEPVTQFLSPMFLVPMAMISMKCLQFSSMMVPRLFPLRAIFLIDGAILCLVRRSNHSPGMVPSMES